jgi:WD40 repeat protein
VIVWDTTTWEKVREIPAQVNHPGAFNLSPDGKLAAIGMVENVVKVVDVDSGVELANLPVDFDKFTYVEFSPDGNWLAASGGVDWSGGGGRVAVWDISNGFEQVLPPKILNGDFRLAQHVNFSPDSTRLASCGGDEHGEVWNLETGQRELLLQGHNANIWEIHFSLDGKYLVTASYDNTVRVWDSVSGAQLLTYSQPIPGSFYMAYFYNDSQRIVAFGDSGYYYQYFFQDFDQLLEIVRSRVARDWKPEECRIYLRSETCPELP